MSERMQARIEFLCGVSSFFAGREAADGSVVCPRHGLEHTGRVVYSAAIEVGLKIRAIRLRVYQSMNWITPPSCVSE